MRKTTTECLWSSIDCPKDRLHDRGLATTHQNHRAAATQPLRIRAATPVLLTKLQRIGRPSIPSKRWEGKWRIRAKVKWSSKIPTGRWWAFVIHRWARWVGCLIFLTRHLTAIRRLWKMWDVTYRSDCRTNQAYSIRGKLPRSEFQSSLLPQNTRQGQLRKVDIQTTGT